MFKKADLDDDGFITMEDFYNIITHQVYWDQR
jgi:Ca2+-binding EF-hand superfamily protein